MFRRDNRLLRHRNPSTAMHKVTHPSTIFTEQVEASAEWGEVSDEVDLISIKTLAVISGRLNRLKRRVFCKCLLMALVESDHCVQAW